MAKYDAAQLRQMAASGAAMKDGSYPIGDTEDLQNAIHAVGRGSGSHDAIRAHIIKRAAALGKSSMIPDNWSSGGSMSGRADVPFTRSYALEDVSIRSGGDGRTVEAYAAVFNQPTSIRDQDGEYEEIIAPAAFNRAIGLANSSGHRIPVMFNHGQTLFGTPSELDTMPIGVTEEIEADKRGLRTVARYHKSERADAVLEGIREGSIGSYSFSGAFRTSEPSLKRGSRYSRGQTVRRTESTLREYGPTPFPAYSGAAIVGVRAEQAARLLGNLDPDERQRLVGLLQAGTDLSERGTSSDGDPAAGDQPEEEHSTRSPHETIRASYAQFISRRKAT